MKEKYYAQDISQIEKELHTSLDNGLSDDEAKKRLASEGPNSLASKKKRSMFMRFIDQFKDFMIIVLIVAAVLSGVVANEWTDAAIIMIVVLLNAILGVIQEARSEAAIDALKEMSTPNAHVRRGGAILEIPSTDIVPGDVVLLEAGDVVPADMRLAKTASLKVEESALTGESVPVEKDSDILKADDVALGDRVNMAYANTNVTYGRAEGIVVGTGMKTEVGKIATMLNNADETATPLKENLNQLGKTLTIMILAICVIVFVVGMFTKQGSEPTNKLIIDMFLVAVSLAVAAIPEGLPAIVTIILALGTQTMAKHRAIVRKLPAVETLGATDIICSDKTGTLTQNQMTVEKVYYDGELHNDEEAVKVDNPAMMAMILANDTKIEDGGRLLGDPTETALIQYAFDQNVKVEDLLKKDSRVQEVPFDSERKLMSTVNHYGDKFFVAVKGAPDELLKRVTKIEKKGQVTPVSDSEKENILASNKNMAEQALRVLGLAYKIVDKAYDDPTTNNVEQDLIFAGLVGMIDPERPEAKAAVAEAKSAGIRTVMITGDHQITAAAIASRLGILETGSDKDKSVITGVEPVEPGIMKKKPRGRKSNFFSGGVASSIIYQGILEGILVLGAYQFGLHVGPHVGNAAMQHADALTMAFLTLGLIQLFHAFNSKFIHKSIFRGQTFENKWFNGAIIISALVMAAVEIPFLTKIFDVTELDGMQWLVVIIAGLLMIIIVEIVKFFERRTARK